MPYPMQSIAVGMAAACLLGVQQGLPQARCTHPLNDSALRALLVVLLRLHDSSWGGRRAGDTRTFLLGYAMQESTFESKTHSAWSRLAWTATRQRAATAADPLLSDLQRAHTLPLVLDTPHVSSSSEGGSCVGSLHDQRDKPSCDSITTHLATSPPSCVLLLLFPHVLLWCQARGA